MVIWDLDILFLKTVGHSQIRRGQEYQCPLSSSPLMWNINVGGGGVGVQAVDWKKRTQYHPHNKNDKGGKENIL